MKLMFIGAAHEVTGSCTYIEVGDKKGVVDYGMENYGFKRSLVARSDRVIVAIDSSKLGRAAHCITCPTEHITALVTDSAAPAELLAQLRGAGVDVTVTAP